MSVAVTGAFLIGQWPEAAMVMALYAIAELIEARAVDRARNAIKGLMALAPEMAEARQANGSWAEMPTKSIAIGTVVRIKPGGRVPLDGVVTAGSSAVDQASVTGESIPVDKALDDSVFAGTHQPDRRTGNPRHCSRRRLDPGPHSSTRSNRHKAPGRRRSASSTALPRSTRPRCSSSRWRWRR
jgi:P-type E1-E2 ATPase